jgi:hypothetical protein
LRADKHPFLPMRDGFAVFDDLVITVTGQYNLVFSAAGVSNFTSNVFTITAADADPANTDATVPNGSAGDATNITIIVRDQFENRVEDVASSLSASVISGPNSGATFTSVTESGNGVYTISYTPEVIGTDEVAINLNEIEIQGSPYTSEVTTSDAENVNIEQQPQETVAGENIQGPPSVFVGDGLGNPVSGVEVTVNEQGGYQFDSGTTTVATNGDGIAVFSDLVINIADTYTLEFDAVGVNDNITSASFDVIPASVSSGQSSVSVNPPTLSVGETSTLTIQVRDAFNNEIEGLTENEISIVLSGEAVTMVH